MMNDQANDNIRRIYEYLTRMNEYITRMNDYGILADYLLNYALLRKYICVHIETKQG